MLNFHRNDLPDMYEAVEYLASGATCWFWKFKNIWAITRCDAVAMDSTDGLQRGIPVRRTGAPIKVPVGDATLGRVFNVLGKPVITKDR